MYLPSTEALTVADPLADIEQPSVGSSASRRLTIISKLPLLYAAGTRTKSSVLMRSVRCVRDVIAV